MLCPVFRQFTKLLLATHPLYFVFVLLVFSLSNLRAKNTLRCSGSKTKPWNQRDVFVLLNHNLKRKRKHIKYELLGTRSSDSQAQAPAPEVAAQFDFRSQGPSSRGSRPGCQ